jgi:hypothetical protein
MRPTPVSSNSDSEILLLLDKFNYDEWKFELDNLCRRKKATTEENKFAWLVRTVNSSDKRIIMKYKSGVVSFKVKDGDEMKIVEYAGADYPFTLHSLLRA